MLDTEDIKKITEAQRKLFYTKSQTDEINKRFATKREIAQQFFAFKEYVHDNFPTKDEMNAKFSEVLTAVDGIAKSFITHDQEMAILGFRMKSAED